MVKGVNRQIIEINDTGNKYFEKALLFVTPGRGDISPCELNKQAKEYLLTLSSKEPQKTGLREKWKNKNRKRILFFSAAAGICLAVAVITVFNIL